MEEEPCPVCAEMKDVTDMNFTPPCPCGFPVCLFCYHRLRQGEGGRCPACRQPYGALGDTVCVQQREPVQHLKAGGHPQGAAAAGGSPPKAGADFGGRGQEGADAATGKAGVGQGGGAVPRAAPKYLHAGDGAPATLPSGAAWAVASAHPPQRPAQGHAPPPPPPPPMPAIADASAWPDLAAAAQQAAGAAAAHRNHHNHHHHNKERHNQSHAGAGHAEVAGASASSSFLSDASHEQQHHRTHSHSGSSQSLHDAPQASGPAQDPAAHPHQAYPHQAVGQGAAHEAGSQLLALLRHQGGRQAPTQQVHQGGHDAAALASGHVPAAHEHDFGGLRQQHHLVASTADSAMLPAGQLPPASKPPAAQEQQQQQHGAGLHLAVCDLFHNHAQQHQQQQLQRGDSLFGDGSAALFGALAQLQQPPAVKPSCDSGAAMAGSAGGTYDIWSGGILLDHHQQRLHQRQDSFSSATTLTGYESSSFGSSFGSVASRLPAHHLQPHHSQGGHHMMHAEGHGAGGHTAMGGGPFAAGPAFGAGPAFVGKAPPPGFAGLGHLTAQQQQMLFGGAFMPAPDAAAAMHEGPFGGAHGGDGGWYQPMGHGGSAFCMAHHAGMAYGAGQAYMNVHWH